MNLNKDFFRIIISLMTVACFALSCVSLPPIEFDVDYPEGEDALKLLPFQLVQQGRIDLFEKLTESSGLAKIKGLSLTDAESDLVVTHNDSFSSAELYLLGFNIAGTFPVGVVNLRGRAFNFDWEAIAPLGEGRVVVADSGNNWKFRRAIPLYFIDFREVKIEKNNRRGEPVTTSPIVLSFLCRFPGSVTEQKNYDCEALFRRQNFLYFLTKEQGGSRLCGVEIPQGASDFAFAPKSESPWLEKRGRRPKVQSKTFPMVDCGTLQTGSQTSTDNWSSLVTSADYHEKSGQLVVLTYGNILVFQEKTTARVKKQIEMADFKLTARIPLPAAQWEGVCFLSENKILATCEQGDYRIYQIGEIDERE